MHCLWILDVVKLGICFAFNLGLLCMCFCFGPLVFVGVDDESIGLSDGMVRCTVAMVVSTCVNGLSLIKSVCALLGLLILLA